VEVTLAPGQASVSFDPARTGRDAMIKAVTDAVFGTIKSVIESVLNVIRGIVNVVMGLLTGDWSRAWEGIKQIGSGIWNAIKSIAEGVFNALKAALSLVWDAIKAAWQALWDGAKAIWDAAGRWISSIGGWIKGFFSGAINWLKGIGEDILNGLWNGLKAVWDRIWGWLCGIADKIKGAFKKVLSIFSPSRVMMDLGRMTMLGFQIGLEKQPTPIFRVVDHIASGVAERASAAGTFKLNATPSYAAAGAVAGANAAGGNVTSHTYHITVDGSKIKDWNSFLESIEQARRLVEVR
jgi:hypothetical protein